MSVTAGSEKRYPQANRDTLIRRVAHQEIRMPHADFVHLRVHSAYSLSEGAITPKALAELAKRAEMPAVAVTDTGNLFGAMEFAGYAKDAGVQPITGCLLGIARPDQDPHAMKQPAPDRLLLLAQSEVGYGNLMKLSSK